MMANFLGLTTFNKGISNYLHANSLSNANQDDLWDFLTAAGQVLSTKVLRATLLLLRMNYRLIGYILISWSQLKD